MNELLNDQAASRFSPLCTGHRLWDRYAFGFFAGSNRGWRSLTKPGATPVLILLSLLLFGIAPTASWAGDLSKYRNLQFGTDLATVAVQLSVSPDEAKVIHRRPVLIQELAWRPRSSDSPSQTESAKDVVLSFYDGELFRISVNYDRFQTEGLTAEDIVEAISATYGMAAKAPPSAETARGPYGDLEEVLVQWQDPQYRFDLIRSSYGPAFRLVGLLKRLEAPAQAAILEGKRLDDEEAPQRDAARILREEDAARTKLEKTRLVNKPKFRP